MSNLTLASRAADSQFLDRLSELTPEQRSRLYRGRALTAHRCVLWASAYPDEPPLLNGEFEWIALGLADLD